MIIERTIWPFERELLLLKILHAVSSNFRSLNCLANFMFEIEWKRAAIIKSGSGLSEHKMTKTLSSVSKKIHDNFRKLEQSAV